MNTREKKEIIQYLKSKKKIFYWILLILLILIVIVGFININPIIMIIAFSTSFLVIFLDYLFEKKKPKNNQETQDN